MKKIMVMVIATAILLGLGFGVTAGLVFIVCKLLGIAYSVRIAAAVWIILMIVSAVIRNAVHGNE